MKNKYLFLLVPIFVGCATTSEPTVRVVTQRVEVPIAVPCKAEEPVKPDYCFPKLDMSADIYDKVKCILSDRKLRIAYETELYAALKSCK